LFAFPDVSVGTETETVGAVADETVAEAGALAQPPEEYVTENVPAALTVAVAAEPRLFDQE
jgi:hypothetical protein